MDRNSIFTGALVLTALTGCTHTLPRTTAARPEHGGFELPIVALSAAGRHVCAVGYADPVQCMFVDGPRTAVVDVPGTEGAIDVAVSTDRACVLFGSGRVSCFGWRAGGTTTARLVEGIDDAFQIAVGGEAVCARSELGSVRCASGEGAAFDVTGVSDAVEIAADAGHACARTAGGDVTCWTTLDPVAHPAAGIHGATALAGGESGIFAMSSRGELHRLLSWGRPEWVFSSVVASMPGVSEIVVADRGVCGTTPRGQALCWEPGSREARVAPRLEGTRELSMGSRFACAVSGDGDLRCASLGANAAHAVAHDDVVTAWR